MLANCEIQTPSCLYSPQIISNHEIYTNYTSTPINVNHNTNGGDDMGCGGVRHMADSNSSTSTEYHSQSHNTHLYNSVSLYSSLQDNTYHDHFIHQMQVFWEKRVVHRKMMVSQAIHEVMIAADCILRMVGQVEPRFNYRIQTDPQTHRVVGLRAESLTEFNLNVYLNHMSVFSVVEEVNQPGYAALKLADGKKRSMSLWVEFITASGFLSSRKLKCKFLSVVTQILESQQIEGVQLMQSNLDDCRLLISGAYILNILPTFKWKDTCDQSISWSEAHVDSIELEARGAANHNKTYSPESDKHQNSSEADSWMLSYKEVEDRMVESYSVSGCKDVLSILKCLRDKHLFNNDNTIININNHLLTTLLLYEIEKHPHDSSWQTICYVERVNSILLQLIACLQSSSLAHYFRPNLNLLRLENQAKLSMTSRKVWSLARQIMINPSCFNFL